MHAHNIDRMHMIVKELSFEYDRDCVCTTSVYTLVAEDGTATEAHI